jgi:centromere/kinetochore protein ZW10
MSSLDIQARIGPALVDYAGNGTFPEEESVAAAHIEDSTLPEALNVLNNAKAELEVCNCTFYVPYLTCTQRSVLMAPPQIEIRQISRQTIPDVEVWMTNARAVHEDIERLRRLATEIVREAEADEDRLERLADRKAHLDLLERESVFNKQLSEELQFISQVNDAVEKTERVAGDSNILEALRLLAGAMRPAYMC